MEVIKSPTLVFLKTAVEVARRRALNFIEGSNITLTVADNATTGAVDVTVAASVPTIVSSITATYDGIQTTRVGTLRWYPQGNITLISCTAFAATAPTGQAMLIDVNKNGASILASPLSIAAGANSSTVDVPTTTALTATDYLTWDIDQIGNTEPGRDVTLRIVYSIP